MVPFINSAQMREEEKTTEGCLQIGKRNVKYIFFKFRNIYGHGLILRVCPREHQAVVLHATSPISMKLLNLKGLPQNSKDKLVSVLVFPRGR